MNNMQNGFFFRWNIFPNATVVNLSYLVLDLLEDIKRMRRNGNDYEFQIEEKRGGNG